MSASNSLVKTIDLLFSYLSQEEEERFNVQGYNEMEIYSLEIAFDNASSIKSFPNTFPRAFLGMELIKSLFEFSYIYSRFSKRL
ncbi:hypothetical protein ACOSQ3_018867 [Xanthoceras sorbifolium]